MGIGTDFTKALKPYLSVLFLFWVVGFFLLWEMGYHESFLFLNKYHSLYLDPFVPHLTNLGDSLILSSLILFFLSPKDTALSFTMLISILLSGLVLVSLKQFVFNEWHRPLVILGENAGIHYIKGYVEYYRSFPSGHTTTIASAFPMIAFYFRHKYIQILIALAGLFLCYTRIYLGAHFLGDVLAGSLLGTTFSIFSIMLIYPAIKHYFSNNMEIMQKANRIAWWLGLSGLILGITVRYYF